MSPDVTPALRLAGRGLLAAGALAAGAAVGAIAERTLMRSVSTGKALDTELGTLRGDARAVPMADGTVLHVEVDEAPDAVDDLTIVFAHHLRYVVRSHRARKTDLAQCSHRLSHIGWSIVMKRLCKSFGGPTYISKMYVLNLVPKMLDCLGNIASHRCECTLAETDRIAFGVVPPKQFIETID